MSLVLLLFGGAPAMGVTLSADLGTVVSTGFDAVLRRTLFADLAVLASSGIEAKLGMGTIYTPGTSGWVVKVVERDGTLVRSLANANVLSVSEELNEPGETRFTFPKLDPASAAGQAADVAMLKREVQVFHDGDLMFSGAPVTGSSASDRGDVQVTAPGLPWYVTRRSIDKPRQNRLNPDVGEEPGQAQQIERVCPHRARGELAGIEVAEPPVGELDQRVILDQTMTSIHTSDGDHERLPEPSIRPDSAPQVDPHAAKPRTGREGR